MSRRRWGGLALALALAAAPALAQQPAPGEAITEERARPILEFLAGDELLGRDSPSPGLERAAEFLAGRFAEAGLTQLPAGSWLRRFQLPGLRLESRGLSLRVRRQAGDALVERELVGDADVRLLRPGDAGDGSWSPATVATLDDPRVQHLLLASAGRRPILLEVDASHPAWQACAGVREVLGVPVAGGRPVLLVRAGTLPPDGVDGAGFTVSYRVPPAEAVDVTLANVVGVLPGRELADEFVLVSAHYDHIGVGPMVGGDGIYNGADDDATGTAAVVLLAEALAAGPRPRRSVAFVCFAAEEKGLLGSRAFVTDPPMPLAQVVANVNVEMIGRPPPEGPRRAWITGAGYSDLADIAGPALQRAGITLVEFALADALFAMSDNFSLAHAGVVAHSISAGSLHADYHQPSDEVSRLDLPHLVAVVRGLREVVLELANRPARPAWNARGREVLERTRPRGR